MRKAFFLWAPVALWAGVIFYLSSIPDLSSGLEMDFLLRKSAHMTEYAILALLLWRAWAVDGRPTRRVFLLSFSAALLYAVSDEWHQSFVPGRGPSAVDVAIDAAAALAACGIRAWRSP